MAVPADATPQLGRRARTSCVFAVVTSRAALTTCRIPLHLTCVSCDHRLPCYAHSGEALATASSNVTTLHNAPACRAAHRPPAFRERTPAHLHIGDGGATGAGHPGWQPSPVPVLTPNPLFADAAGASFAPLRDGATPRGDADCSASAGFGPLAWDAALLNNTAAFIPASSYGGAQAQLGQPARADGQAPASADASLSETAGRLARQRRRREAAVGPLEASLPRLSAAERRSIGAGAAAMLDGPGPRTGAADATAARAATGCTPNAGPAAALAAAAARLAALEAHAGAVGQRAAAAQAALASRRAAISTRQSGPNKALVRPPELAAPHRKSKRSGQPERHLQCGMQRRGARQGACARLHVTVALDSTPADLTGLLSISC